ncbi:MAG: translocation/assembly module TamB domain-containing protein [Elusimicrobiota bacterium]
MSRFWKATKRLTKAALPIAIFIWLAMGFLFNRFAGSLVEKNAQDRFGLTVTVGKVSTNFLNALNFHDVVIRSPASASIKKIRLSFQPWNSLPFFSGRYPVFKILISELIGDIDFDLFRTPKKNEFTFFSTPYPLRFEIENSSLNLISDQYSDNLRKVTGTIDLNTTSAKGTLQMFSGVLGEYKLSGIINTNQNWEATLKAKSIAIESMKTFFQEENTLKYLKGFFSVDSHATGVGFSGFENLSYKAIFKSEKLFIRSPFSKTFLPIQGKVQLVPSALEIENFNIARSMNIRGKINNPFKNAVMDLTLRGESVNIDNLLFEPRENAEEKEETPILCDFNGSVKGEIKNPIFIGDFLINSFARGIRFPSLGGAVSFNNKSLKIDAHSSKAKITAEIPVYEGNHQPIKVNIQGLDLSGFAGLNGWGNVDGVFDASILSYQNEDQFDARGQFSLKQFRWGRFRNEETYSGLIKIKNNSLSLVTENDAFDVFVNRNKNNLQIQDAHINLGNNSRLEMNGDVNFVDNLINVFVNGRGIPPDVWPPLVSRFPDISGQVDFGGKVEGSIQNPNLSLSTQFSDVRLLKDGNIWQGKTKLNWTPQSLSLTEIKLSEGYVGDFAYLKEKKQSKININFIDANPRFIFEIFKSTLSVNGVLNGGCYLKLEDEASVGVSTFSILNGSVGGKTFDEVTFSANLKGNQISLNNFSLLSENKSLALSGNGKIIDKKINFDVLLQSQRMGTDFLFFDGEIKGRGIFDFARKTLTTDLSAPLFWINDYQWEDLKAKVDLGISSLRVSAKANAETFFNFHLNRISKKISGNFSSQIKEVDDLLTKLTRSETKMVLPKGSAVVESFISGVSENPQIKLHVTSPKLLWRNEEVNLDLLMQVNHSTISIEGAKVLLGSGGEIFLSGVVSESGILKLALEGAGAHLTLNSVAHLLEWPIRWDGETNAKFEMKGSSTAKEISIAFDGRHDGFGPFKKEGRLSGKVIGKNKDWDISDIRVTIGEGFAQLRPGSMVYLDKNRTGKIHVLADARNLKAGILTLFGGVEIIGNWDKTKNINGSTSPIELDVFARGLWVNQFYLEGSVTRLQLFPGRLTLIPIPGSGIELSGAVFYKDYPDIRVSDFRFLEKGQSKIQLNGYVGSPKWDFDLVGNGIDANFIRSIFDTNWPVSGPMNFEIKGSGSKLKPHLKGNVAWNKGKIALFPLDEAKAIIDIQGNSLKLENLKVTKNDGYLVSGNLKLGINLNNNDPIPDPEISLSIEKGNLGILQDIWSACSKSKGNFNGNIFVGMKQGKRVIDGFLKADKIYLESDYTTSLKKGELSLRLQNNYLSVESGSAQIGTGNIELGGSVDFIGTTPVNYNLTLNSIGDNGIDIRIPELAIAPGPLLSKISLFNRKLAGVSRGKPRLALFLKGPAQSPQLGGEIILEDTVFTYPPQEKNRGSAESSFLSKWWDSFKQEVNWDFTLLTGNKTWYQNDRVDSSVKGKIRIKGNSPGISVVGQINTTQGAIVYGGSEFQIIDATLELIDSKVDISTSSPATNIVYLKAKAQKEIYYTDPYGGNNQDVITMVVGRAQLGEIEPRFISKNNPSLSSERALKLALGIPMSDPIENSLLLPEQRDQQQKSQFSNDTMLRLGLVQLLDSSLASPLARALAKNTGLVDFIRVSYQEKDPLADQEFNPTEPTASTNNNITQNQFLRYAKGTKVKFGREITDRLFADYSFRVDELNNQFDLRHEVELAYRIHRNFFLRGISELDTARTLGRSPDRRALIENQWRFGLPKVKTQTNLNENIQNKTSSQTK